MSESRLKDAIKMATLELCCGNQPLEHRLARAIRRLDGFLGRRESWPSTLYSRSQDISDAFRGAESVDVAIADMEPAQLERLAERILHLYVDCQATDLDQRE